jgi:hypothetical protein
MKINFTIEVIKVNIKRAYLEDIEIVKHIVHGTIKEVYPHYYPSGIVNFFLNHHCDNNIQKAIETENVLLLNDVLCFHNMEKLLKERKNNRNL